jgi:hypothetical protein
LGKCRGTRRGPVSVPGHLYQSRAVGHITSSRGKQGQYRYDCLPAPVTPASASRPDITGDTESGDGRVHRTRHVNAPHPLLLELSSFGASEHGVSNVAVAIEHRVVVPERHGGTVA